MIKNWTATIDHRSVIVTDDSVIASAFFNNSVRSEDYLTETYPDIPLLTVIPDTAPGKEYGYYKKHGYYKKSRYYGAYTKQDGGEAR